MDLIKNRCIIGLGILLYCVVLNGQIENDQNELSASIQSDRDSFSDSNNVAIELVVENRSTVQQKFFLYDEPYTTFQPVVYDISGREAETRVGHRLSGVAVEAILNLSKRREVVLYPGEKYSQKINLADFYSLVPGREYKLRLLFLKDAASPSAKLSTNICRFKVHAADRQQAKNLLLKDGQAADSTIRPEEVVYLFLLAEKSKHWADYIKYLDLDQYIYSYPDYASVYVAGNKIVQNETLSDFTQFLSQTRHDTIIEYQVLSETIQQNQAFVEVVVKRASARKPFSYKYTYSLEKKSRAWMITGVTASVSRIIKR